LPFQNEFDKLFENFIIFRPKDVVSGDFYWYSEVKPDKESKDLIRFLAVVDCTGHGVPGAFMSMIGNTLLNEIVNSKKILETNKILIELDKNIKISLNQKKTGNMDGMDLCFCKFEIKENSYKFQFTGAKNNLYFIKKQTKKVEWLKADRKSIGGIFKKQRKIEFTTQNINFQKGDLIYLSTDGFIDQNNFERKRIGTPKLIAILDERY